VEQVNAAWLTAVLQQSGALKEGAVEAYEVIEGETRLSSNARLKLTYATGSHGDLPQKLFLKLVNTDQDDEFFGDSELTYYVRDYVGVEGAPLLRCYDGAYSAVQRRYHLLMEDVSETHVPSIERPLSLEHGYALAEGLATLHAHWWGREGIAAYGESLPSDETIRRYVGMCEPGAGYIIASCADQLKAHWSEALLEFYAQHPRLMIDRTHDGNGFTMVHGDVNAFNVLIPIEGDRPIYVIDRQPFDWSLKTWLGVSDFSFALVIDCAPETRRQLEQPILKHYHEQLIQQGVQGYSWEQLWRDYRLAAAACIYTVTEWSRGGLNTEFQYIWMPMLQRTMTAYDDLECGKLWTDT
jgi:hypothetical protein